MVERARNCSFMLKEQNLATSGVDRDRTLMCLTQLSASKFLKRQVVLQLGYETSGKSASLESTSLHYLQNLLVNVIG